MVKISGVWKTYIWMSFDYYKINVCVFHCSFIKKKIAKPKTIFKAIKVPGVYIIYAHAIK